MNTEDTELTAEKMKIGILTLPFNNNYGGYLQAYALMTVLKGMGHEPTLIMRRANKPQLSFTFKVKYAIKRVIKTLLRFKKYPLVYDMEDDFRRKGKNMFDFVNKNMVPQTPYFYDTDSMREYCKDKFDAYIVGSDQVWRAIYVPDIKNYFLDFTEEWNVKRIAYAASFGTAKPEYTDEQIRQCGELLKKFDSVSVREESGLDVTRQFRWCLKSGQSVLDPTMLLSAADYAKVLPTRKAKSQNKIFCYILDCNEKVEAILSKAKTLLEKELVGISNIQKVENVLPSIEEWLTNIRDADFVVTDSFHGMVFSIIFHKPFAICVNEGRGSERFFSLLRTLELGNRILADKRNIDDVVHQVIDWTYIDMLLSRMKKESLLYLKDSLN